MKVNILIGTPAYNSMVHTDYMHSLLKFRERKIPFTTMTIGNESLITRGRNNIISYCYHQQEIFSHLLFLDADIGMTDADLIKLLSHKKDVIGAPVPLKGKDTFGRPVYNVGKIIEQKQQDLITTDRVGTAVFMLSMRVVVDLIEHAKKQEDVYLSNPLTRGNMEQMQSYDVFKAKVINGEYLSEDYYVCNVLRTLLGYSVYVDPTIKVKHNGMFVFE